MPRRKKQNGSKKKVNNKNNNSNTKTENNNRIKKISFNSKEYINSSPSASKDVILDRYFMSTPDGATSLLEDVSIKITFGNRYGLVGKNGYGKTTLLKNMANYNIEEFPKNIRMVHVEQERKIDEKNTVIDAVLKSDTFRTDLIQESERLEEAICLEDDYELQEEMQNQLDEICQLMEEKDLQNSHSKAFKILIGLGFSKKSQKEKVCSLSGGWRMRVEIAKALFVSPDLLLLDEPTNHLDFPAVLWLQDHLSKNFKNTLIVVSHDKLFLNNVITNTIYLNHENKTLEYYKGNYNSFETCRAEKLKTIENDYRAHEFQISALKDFINKFKDKGEKRQAQVQSKLKTLKKLEESIPEKPNKLRPFKFEFPQPIYIEQHLLTFTDVNFGYIEDKTILHNVNLALDMDSRVGVIGENGIGKSTLIKLMLKNLTPQTGQIESHPQARFSYFSQHHYDQLDFEKNAVEYFLNKFSDTLSEEKDRVMKVRKHLGRFGIRGDRQNQKMKFLSGGQKSRVSFAQMTFKTPHLILMDEPTNHLDLETVDALIDAISKFEGGVIAISHDTHFLKEVAKAFWTVTKEKIVRFDNFEDAKDFALKKRIDEIETAEDN